MSGDSGDTRGRNEDTQPIHGEDTHHLSPILGQPEGRPAGRKKCKWDDVYLPVIIGWISDPYGRSYSSSCLARRSTDYEVGKKIIIIPVRLVCWVEENVVWPTEPNPQGISLLLSLPLTTSGPSGCPRRVMTEDEIDRRLIIIVIHSLLVCLSIMVKSWNVRT